MADRTVIILPETSGCLVCAEYRRTIINDDFLVFHGLIESTFRELGRVRLFVNFDESFCGWEHDAAESNMLSISTYAPKVEKLAYVNPPAQKIFQMKLSQPLFKSPVRFYNKDDYAVALKWIQE